MGSNILCQTLAVDELGHNVTEPVVRASDVMDGSNPVVFQLSNSSGFRDVFVNIAFIANTFRMRNLDGHFSMQFVVEAQVDSSKRASSEDVA